MTARQEATVPTSIDEALALAGLDAPIMDTGVEVMVVACDCGCVFIPEGDIGSFWPDRFQRPGSEHECPCHQLRYSYPEVTDAD